LVPVGGSRLDILLIAVGSPHPAAARVGRFAGIPPLGIAYLAAVLRRQKLRVRLADLNVPGWTRRRLTRCLEVERPPVVGISCTTESYRNAIRLAAMIRRHDSAIRIVVGGPHVTFLDEAALRTGHFDVVVRGEGERTVEELVPILIGGMGSIAPIGGISFLEAGRLKRTPPRERITDLDILPWPARDLLPMERYGSPGALLTGRGCPGSCPFCSASAMSGGRYRVRSVPNVIEEIQALLGAGIDEITFLDDTLTGDRPRLERLLDRLENDAIPIRWSCESRLEAVDRPLLRRMARLGCHSIQYGIESGSEETQDRLGKGTSVGRIESALRETDSAGIAPVCSFILGLPWENEASLLRTIDFALRLQRNYLARIGFGMLVCYPGTRFWTHATALGIKRRTHDFDLYTMHCPTCDTPFIDRENLRGLYFDAVLQQIRQTPPGLIELSPGAARWLARARKDAVR